MINTFGSVSLHRGRYLRTTYFYFWSKWAKRKVIDDREQEKRQRREEECIIHCCNDTGESATLKDLESWKTLLNTAIIGIHEPILEIAKTLGEGELTKVTYHRQCRSTFTLKRNFDKLSQLDANERANCNSTDNRRSSIRQPKANPSRIYQRVCIFCERDKYTRNSRISEELIQCVDMRADETVGKVAVGKMIPESWLLSLESLWLLKRATISHAIAITPGISLFVAIRKKTTSISNIPVPNCRGMRNC